MYGCTAALSRRQGRFDSFNDYSMTFTPTQTQMTEFIKMERYNGVKMDTKDVQSIIKDLCLNAKSNNENIQYSMCGDTLVLVTNYDNELEVVVATVTKTGGLITPDTDEDLIPIRFESMPEDYDPFDYMADEYHDEMEAERRAEYESEQALARAGAKLYSVMDDLAHESPFDELTRRGRQQSKHYRGGGY